MISKLSQCVTGFLVVRILPYSDRIQKFMGTHRPKKLRIETESKFPYLVPILEDDGGGNSFIWTFFAQCNMAKTTKKRCKYWIELLLAFYYDRDIGMWRKIKPVK